MNQFINQPVVNWARQSFPQTVEVKLKENSIGFKILLGICFAILALVFLGIPLLLYVSAFKSLIHDGWNENVSRGLMGGTVWLLIFGVLALGFFLLMRFIRRNLVKFFSAEGVETRNGQKLVWEKLYFLNHKNVSTRVHGNLIASLVRAMMFAGVEKVTVEMIFENGKAIVPPLIENQPQILALLNSMPVQRRDEGKIRQ